MAINQESLEAGYFYHIYNQSVGNEPLFNSERNYNYFIERYKHYITPIAETFAYCLMPNHFHFLVKIKDNPSLRGFETLVGMEPARQFSHLFNSYAQAVNKERGRHGSLFKNRFKRKKVDNEDYLRRLIIYIHCNPVLHGFTKLPEEWGFSSYHNFLSDKPTFIEKEFVIELFDSMENFLFFHKEKIEVEKEFSLE